MEVIQFPPARLLDFDGMGIKIDVEAQRESWAATFFGVQIALRFCNLDCVEAEKFIDADTVAIMGFHWTDSIEYLESVVAIMKAALARLEASEDRALGRKRRVE